MSHAGHKSPPADIRNGLIVLSGIAFTLVVAVLIIFVRDYFFVVRNETVTRQQLVPGNPKLEELRTQEEATLGSYGWVDREKGTVRIPIDRAMELVVRESAGATPAGPEGDSR